MNFVRHHRISRFPTYHTTRSSQYSSVDCLCINREEIEVDMEIKEHNPPSFQFPPGFRFHPSDEELMVHYLKNKAASNPLPASIIAEIDIYKYNPWELPKKALLGEDEWYFFSPRDRKYPNGERPNRAAGTGYWKATGTDRPILSSLGSKLGVKKALVFYQGRPPRGVKTEWMMIEYRLDDDSIVKPSRSKGSMRLDDWVLCRIRLKSNTPSRAGEIQDTNKAELVSYSPKIQEALPNPTDTSNNADMIRDCLNKDCRLLASILAGQALPPIEPVSTLSCQGSSNGNSFTSIFEDDTSRRVNSPLIISSLDTKYINPPYSKKPKNDNRDQDLQFTKVPPNDINYHGQCLQGIFTNPSDPFVDFQQVHESAFIGKY